MSWGLCQQLRFHASFPAKESMAPVNAEECDIDAALVVISRDVVPVFPYALSTSPRCRVGPRYGTRPGLIMQNRLREMVIVGTFKG